MKLEKIISVSPSIRLNYDTGTMLSITRASTSVYVTSILLLLVTEEYVSDSRFLKALELCLLSLRSIQAFGMSFHRNQLVESFEKMVLVRTQMMKMAHFPVAHFLEADFVLNYQEEGRKSHLQEENFPVQN